MRRTRRTWIPATFALLMASGIDAQAPVERIDYKSPGTATLIAAVFPGGGHLYAGESGRGLVVMGLAFAAPVAGALLYTKDAVDCAGDFGNCTVDEGTAAPLYVGAAIGLAAWIYGIADAGKAAGRANLRNGLSEAPVRPLLQVGSQGLRAGIRFDLDVLALHR